LRIEEEPTDMFMTSAPSRLPASSNEDCVRVEASKNRLIDLGAAAQRRTLLLNLAVQIDEFLCKIEQSDDLIGRKPLHPQQMPLVENEGSFRGDVH